MRALPRTIVFLLLTAPTSSPAGVLTVKAEDSRGRPLPDLVLQIDPASTEEAHPAPRAPRTAMIDQRDEQFVPYVSVFRPGDRVVFRNSDDTRHHAYSFAPEGAFEFVLRSGEQSDPMALDNPGVIAVGCNIHDRMITYLVVSDATWTGMTDVDGGWLSEPLAPGDYRVEAWHPRLHPSEHLQPRVVHLGEGDAVTPIRFRLRITPDTRMRSAELSDY